jgi:hypothetical protein
MVSPMSTTPPTPTEDQPPPLPDHAIREHIDGLEVAPTEEERVDRRLAEIEMAGEEVAAGFRPAPHHPLSPEVRYLHVSRTIHELITDRNRSVGIFLFVASVLFGASTALLNVPERVEPIIPLKAIQYWCLPVTFGTLALIAAFTSLLLIRARIGLIYEVAKMNTLLGLPLGRVERVNPLSIFYLMHLLVVMMGAGSAGFAFGMVQWHFGGIKPAVTILIGIIVAIVYIGLFQFLYYAMILRATSDAKLQNAKF